MITLEPFNADVHAALLAHWLNLPHVQAAWGDPQENLAYAWTLQPPSGAAMICADARAIGFVQWQPISATELAEAGVAVSDDRTIDSDIFIGDLDWIGRGVGPAAICLVLSKLFADNTIQRATLFTGADNQRALRAYAKVGFALVSHSTDDEHNLSCVLLQKNPRSTE